ncbi:hypothetical protein GCM10009801_72440 [Streptomyces albiaxialis]|uniref:ESX-1 secretion-associated protein n=2 Tax=Streptomyces albiaxialis TaxID=329523 RepID=A0ABN2WWJ5_9ACTN
MELNGAGGGGDGGSGGSPDGGGSSGGGASDLTVHDDELGRIGNLAFGLHGRLQKAGDEARVTTHDAAIYLLNDGGLDDLANAMLKVNDNWGTQVATLKRGFALISNHLDFTRKAHTEDERDIETGLGAAAQKKEFSRIQGLIHNNDTAQA